MPPTLQSSIRPDDSATKQNLPVYVAEFAGRRLGHYTASECPQLQIRETHATIKSMSTSSGTGTGIREDCRSYQGQPPVSKVFASFPSPARNLSAIHRRIKVRNPSILCCLPECLDCIPFPGDHFHSVLMLYGGTVKEGILRRFVVMPEDWLGSTGASVHNLRRRWIGRCNPIGVFLAIWD